MISFPVSLRNIACPKKKTPVQIIRTEKSRKQILPNINLKGENIMAITEKDFEEKAKLLKKTDRKADTLETRALSDEELDNTAGGFWRKKGYAKG